MGIRRTSHTRSESRPTLEGLGYREFGDFFSPGSSRIVSEVRDRVVYLIPADTNGGAGAHYLKVFKNPGANRPWNQLASLEKPHSCAEIEVRRLDWLEEHGFLAPRWVAWGAEMNGFSEARSYLMTQALVGMQGLDDWLVAANGALSIREFQIGKRELLKRSARLLRKLHADGFHHPFPYLRHFFVPEFETTAGGIPNEVPIAMIDVHSAQAGGPVSMRKRARGLAELLISSLEAPLTNGDRVFFLREYGTGKVDRDLAALVLKRFDRKLRKHPNRYARAREEWEAMRFPRTDAGNRRRSVSPIGLPLSRS